MLAVMADKVGEDEEGGMALDVQLQESGEISTAVEQQGDEMRDMIDHIFTGADAVPLEPRSTILGSYGPCFVGTHTMLAWQKEARDKFRSWRRGRGSEHGSVAQTATASHAVTALCARAEVSREEAVAMLGSALRRGQIAHVENMREFSDNDKKLYYYTPRLPPVRPVPSLRLLLPSFLSRLPLSAAALLLLLLLLRPVLSLCLC